MKSNIYILALLLTGTIFTSCKKCYDCSDGVDVVQLCDYNKQKINSDISIYETRGYTCVKK